MSTSLVIALVDIAKKPGASMSTSLITTRRICRIFGERLDSIRIERRAMRRKASKLRQYLPFTASAIAEIEQAAADHRSVEWQDLRMVLAGFGRSLVLDTERLAEGLGFDRLCDLLAINTVERETARKDGLASLADLVFAYALEESAARRGQDWNDAPLFNACQLAMANFIREYPKHLLPDPFAPGAPFGPKLPPDLRLVDK
ncbi:hypothetical protein C4K19_0366 [Pseudomonas chlororaphis subsp. aurantiaca]|uniref:hypothetical protein n=1 Tax=Pseudomonas chlororaphis TaxID=587753 RepID=UPI000F57AC99|nr:hypothetical protein [Pseudomonas chlororaphis]AZD52184.1 hypothetical protein C4K19_0366 [Pseudomonas chlororaphis subsp. aurantiaca]AZD58363.1 hypothetical protein C4K18_0359 [Pseudomonas chlororaphis subsp. aurantiaca]